MQAPSSHPRVFYTDAEFEAGFGAQAAGAVRMLGRHAGGICGDCGGECCRRIGCELYSPRFSACPIFEFRPAKCRLYFCERILESEALSAEERALLNKPAVEISEALRRGWGLGIFIEPPLKIGDRSWLAPLGIEEEVAATVAALEAGATGAAAAAAALRGIVRRCRDRARAAP